MSVDIPRFIPEIGQNEVEVRLNVAAWLEQLSPESFAHVLSLMSTDVQRSVHNFSGTPPVWLAMCLVRDPGLQQKFDGINK